MDHGLDDTDLPPGVVAAHDHAVAAGRDWYPDPLTGFMVLTAEFLAGSWGVLWLGLPALPVPDRRPLTLS